MIYRLATNENIKEICFLVNKAIALMESQSIYQWDEIYPTQEDFESDIKNHSLFLAFEEDKLVSIYVINKECDVEYNDCKWKGLDDTAFILHRFCVSAYCQHKGIGNKVLLHIEEQIKNIGGDSIRLDVFSENPYALRLYKKNGFKNRGFANWRMGRFVLMEKSLTEGI